MDRRTFLKSGLLATAAATTMGRAFWRTAWAAPAQPGPGPYGPLLGPDANGIKLPAGFTSRQVARAGEPVGGSGYLWHTFPDGGATFATPDGGWIYVSNSEVPGAGGAGAVRFAADGSIADAYRILAGTSSNCAGGPTPWGTWLSCEEHDGGLVWECDPTGLLPGLPRPGLGTFKHEAAAVDPVAGQVYLTEDQSNGRFYRFTPAAYPDLTLGTLEAAVVASGAVTWLQIPFPNLPVPTPTRAQVPATTAFKGGEGCWFDAPSRTVYFTTKGDNRVWAYAIDAATIEVIHDRDAAPGSPLKGVDNVIVSRSGDILVAEDGGDMELVLITPDRVISPLLQVTGQDGSEITGPAFDPSGTRLYFSSQRGNTLGITYEVSGPFRG
jgi:secreted PhoX family phosphatase